MISSGVISVTSVLLPSQVTLPAIANDMEPYGVALGYRLVCCCDPL